MTIVEQKSRASETAITDRDNARTIALFNVTRNTLGCDCKMAVAAGSDSFFRSRTIFDNINPTEMSHKDD